VDGVVRKKDGFQHFRCGFAIHQNPGFDGFLKLDGLFDGDVHEEGHKPHEPDVARHLLDELGLDPSVVDEAIDDQSTHDEVRDEHDRVVAAGGYGVPTMFFPEFLGAEGDPECLFGPVLVDPPTGDAAMRLWEATTAWLEFPYLFELQRPKAAVHGAKIVSTLRPYLDARDWVSINRGRVVSLD
jgi:hypothetical protein